MSYFAPFLIIPVLLLGGAYLSYEGMEKSEEYKIKSAIKTDFILSIEIIMIAFPMNLLGKLMVVSLPKLIKLLSIVGTIAMLLVGGGMYVHNIAYIHHYEIYMHIILLELLLGIIVGTIVFYSLGLYKKIKTFI